MVAQAEPQFSLILPGYFILFRTLSLKLWYQQPITMYEIFSVKILCVWSSMWFSSCRQDKMHKNSAKSSINHSQKVKNFESLKFENCYSQKKYLLDSIRSPLIASKTQKRIPKFLGEHTNIGNTSLFTASKFWFSLVLSNRQMSLEHEIYESVSRLDR